MSKGLEHLSYKNG